MKLLYFPSSILGNPVADIENFFLVICKLCLSYSVLCFSDCKTYVIRLYQTLCPYVCLRFAETVVSGHISLMMKQQ